MTPIDEVAGEKPWLRALLDGAAHRLFASTDLDETRTLVGRVMKPHQLGVSGSRQRLDSRMHHVGFGTTSLSRLKYGASVDIVPDRLEEFFLVQMPVAGHAVIASGSECIESTPRLASVLSPSDPIRMRWSPDSDQLMVRIPRRQVERAVASQLGREPGEPVRFGLGMAWRDQPAWQCLMSYLLGCADRGIDLGRSPLLASQIDQLIVTTLLCVQPHNFTDARRVRRAHVLPRHVRKVEEYLRAHAQEPISADQLAALAGISLRSLYSGFRQAFGVGPMLYLRQVRLDRARMDLLGDPHADTVSGVALRWGFGHLGRFSAEYRARFGESPVESLRRR
jgi:AraC-like DNA-binding protein